MDDKYLDKIKFYSDSNCSSEIKDGDVVSGDTKIYGKLTQNGNGMTIPVHIDGEEEIYAPTVSSLNGAGLNIVNINSTSTGTEICSVKDTDITLTASDLYHVQIIKEDSASAFTMHYEIAKPGSDYETWSEMDSWVPYGSRLRVTAEGMDEDYVPVIATKKVKYVHQYRKYTTRTALYKDQNSLLIDLNYETPIHVLGVATAPVTINNTVPDSEKYLSYTYNNGKTLHNGDKLAINETVTISVNGAPEQTAIHTNIFSESGDDSYDRSNYNYYHYCYAEEPSEYTFAVVNGKNVISTEIKILRKVTITKPEGYEVATSWSLWSDGDEECDEHEVDPESSSFLVPDGGYVYFRCYNGITDKVNALKLTAAGSDRALGYIFNNEDSASAVISGRDRNFILSPVNVYKIDASEKEIIHGRLYKQWMDEDEFGNAIYDDIYAPTDEKVEIVKYNVPISEQYQINAYKTGNSATKVLDNEHLNYYHPWISFIMPDFPVTVEAKKEDQKKNPVTIRENNFSPETSASYKKQVSTSATEVLKDGDAVYEDQEIRIDADSIASNKKMLVTIKETGTNEYASGSQQGIFMEGIRPLIFRMLDRPITIEVTEKDRKGSGNSVGIDENISNSTTISYSVESGDLVPKGDEVTLNVLGLKEGKKVHMNVVCPDQNLVASGAGIQNDFSKPYFAREITTTGIVTFTMPDYPITINVWEDMVEKDVIDLSAATINLEQSEMNYTGNEVKPQYIVNLNGQELVKNTNYTESFSNNINAGIATLTVSGKGKYSGSVTKNFTIVKKALDDPGVTLSITNKVIYNYKPKYEPKPVIQMGAYMLREGSDYTLSYANNTAPTDKATVTITGNGNFSGTITKTFAIISETQDLKDAMIQVKETSMEYTGKEITPEITVICNNEMLEGFIDYEVSYLNNINAGTATVKISGLGNYSGSAKKEFTINARKISSSQFDATVANQKFRKNISKYEPQPNVIYGGEKMVMGVDYTLEYAGNNGASTEATVTITGINNYDGSKVLTFSILKEYFDAGSMKVTIESKDFVYDGEEKKPSVTVRYKGKELTEGADYEVAYQDNVDAGTAKIILSGSGEYAGSKTSAFKISPKVISDGEGYVVEDIPDEEYNGMNCPTPKVTDSKTGNSLSLQDINYTYKNNKKVNDNATLRIKGIGNYKGYITKTFKITPLAFDSYEYSIDDCAYTGSKVKPDIIATNRLTGERITLETGIALKVVFSNQIEISGEAKAVISPKNKKFFTIKEGGDATKEITFSIVKCSLEDVAISPVKDQKYNKGKEIKPKLTVKLETAQLKQNKQYKVTYENNKEKGYGTAIITSADETHFEGSQEIKFVIK